MSTTVCVTVTSDGSVGGGWGRADRVAIAVVGDAGIERWQELDVGWGRLHDAGPEGQHHSRIATFLLEHGVRAVVTGHMGPPMVNMLEKMGIAVHVGAAGNAKDAVLRALDH